MTVIPDPAVTDWVPLGGGGGAHYGTTPPASPYDGQEWILPVGNGVLWRFRYNAGSASAYKWEFVGGAPVTSIIETDQGTASTASVDLATVGPSAVLPRGGDHVARFGAEVYNSVGGQNVMLGLWRTGVGLITASETVVYGATGGTVAGASGRSFVITGAGAGDTLKVQYRTGGGTGNFRKRWLEVTPVRVA